MFRQPAFFREKAWKGRVIFDQILDQNFCKARYMGYMIVLILTHVHSNKWCSLKRLSNSFMNKGLTLKGRKTLPQQMSKIITSAIYCYIHKTHVRSSALPAGQSICTCKVKSPTISWLIWWKTRIVISGGEVNNKLNSPWVTLPETNSLPWK